MDDSLGCSKCRYSQKGCARCRDPEFGQRQLAKAPGKNKLSGPMKGKTRGRKRPARTLEGDEVLERPPGSKRTRFTRKARKIQGYAIEPAAGTREQDTMLGGQSSQTVVGEPVRPLSHPQGGPATRVSPQDPSTSQAAPDAAQHVKEDEEATDLQRDSQATAPELDAKAAGGSSKQVASGLELGIMAGLLPLQQGSLGAEPTRRSLEEATLVSKEPAGTTAPRNASSKSMSGGEEGKPMQSTSEHSRDPSQTSTGMDSLDAAQGAQRAEDSGERQRQFMEQLQRKVQDRKLRAEASSKPCLAALLASAARKKKKERMQMAGDPRASLWEPPQSPFGLIEEQLFGNPWKLLVACILLNKTSVVQVRKVIWKLFELVPTPEAGMHADEAAVRELIQPLGLAPKRAPMLIRFCRDYVEKQWMDPKELHGVGQYAADAYNIFCRGDWRSVSPTDKDLLKYHQWLTGTNGEGSGLLRETEPQPQSQLGSPES